MSVAESYHSHLRPRSEDRGPATMKAQCLREGQGLSVKQCHPPGRSRKQSPKTLRPRCQELCKVSSTQFFGDRVMRTPRTTDLRSRSCRQHGANIPKCSFHRVHTLGLACLFFFGPSVPRYLATNQSTPPRSSGRGCHRTNEC